MDKNGPTLAYYVYLLRCSDGSDFAGHTNDLEQRLPAHERGAIEGYTLSRRLVDFVFSEWFSRRLEAFHRERQIKGWSRARKEALIKGDWDGLVELSNRSSSGGGSFDRLRMRGRGFRMRSRGLRMRGRRLRMRGRRLRMRGKRLRMRGRRLRMRGRRLRMRGRRLRMRGVGGSG